jgi:superfamily II DNA or RNA helicase
MDRASEDPRLDTLFLTMPISWKGTLAQYVGRLHRDHQGKSEVIVYDYVDLGVPALARMAARRRTGYRALGYVVR